MKKTLLVYLLAFLTSALYVQGETVTFDFKTNDYGLTRDDNNQYLDNGTAINNGDISVTLFKKTGTNGMCLRSTGLRFYKNSNCGFTVSIENGTINSVTITVSGATFAKEGETTNKKEWSDINADSATFNYTNSGNKDLLTLTVDYTLNSIGQTPVTLSFPQSEYSAEIGGETFTAPTVTADPAAAIAEVKYSSSNEAAATVDEKTGAVTLVAHGTTNITAEITGSETYKNASATYSLSVVDPNRAGTEQNPYTVAQALEACTAKGETGVYVKGIVTSVNTWNSSFSNINYYIADTENGTETLYIFRGMWIDGANITAENQPEVGATVVLKGDFDIYSNTKELINSSIVTYTPSAKETVTITAEPETAKIDLATSELTIANPFTISVEGLEMTYSSDNESVATVDATGLITGVSMGTAVITATFAGNNAYLPAKATFTVNVVDSSIAYTDISTTTLTGDGTGYAVDRSYTDTYGVDFFGRYYSSNGMQFNQGNDNLNGIIVKSNPHKYRIKAIEFTFYSKSTADRTLTLYADNNPYSELESTEGTLISDAIEKGTDNKATVSFEGKDFMYFSLFAPKSVQIENIRVYWVSEKSAKSSAPTFTYDAATKTMAIDVDHGYNIQYYTFFYNPESTVDTPADDSTIVWTDVNGDHCTVSAGETTGTTVFGITARAIDPENADNFAEGTIGVTSDGQTTGIEAVDADSADAAVEYFNLQGVRVAAPAEGLYIRRQGNKVEKVLVK